MASHETTMEHSHTGPTTAAIALLHAESAFPTSFTLVVAVLLLLVGLLAIGSIAFKFGPFN